ncbi:MAG: hypothetical protein GY822_02870 [Deltaproteobacteria bacterium]|nr:hypothetical protein [Deltaproteobacteria bacterium]
MVDQYIPIDVTQALTAKKKISQSEFRAGGTDVVDRIRREIAPPPHLISLGRIKSLFGFGENAGELLVGAKETLEALAKHPLIRRYASVVSDAVAHCATPQIRSQATVGGALAQRVRCPYFRQPDFFCLKKGGPLCLARAGEHTEHGIFDNALCMSLQPSTLALALVAINAEVEIVSLAKPARWVSIVDVMKTEIGLPQQDNGIAKDELIQRIKIPLHQKLSIQHYERLSARQLADWPLVEVAVVAEKRDAQIQKVHIVMGAVGRNIRRAKASEAILLGKLPTKALLLKAAQQSTHDATPGAGNAEKRFLVERCVAAALEGAFL